MSDILLDRIKAHRSAPDVYDAPTFNAMADRIEELEAENARLRDAVYIDDLTVTLQGKDRAAAITGMERALDLILAKLKGETDE